MNGESLNTEQAAARAKVSRPTISRALKSGDLPAIRDNSGKWLIQPDDVDEWSARRSIVHSVQRSHNVQNVMPPPDNERVERLRGDLAASRETVARLEGEAAMNEKRIADLATDRDRWRQMAETLSERQVGPAVRGFWSRLLGRD